MTTADFMLDADMPLQLPALHEFLCDLNNYTPLHPLIESIEELDTDAEFPFAKRYRVVDRIPFGPFRFRTTYIAVLDPVSENEVHGYAWQFPKIRLHTVYALTPTAEGTHLEERVCVEAPRLLRRFIVNQARDAHRDTLARMKTLLEGG
jgi:hypothetical protein